MYTAIISVKLASGKNKTIMICSDTSKTDIDIINHVLTKYDIKSINYIINY